MMLKSHHSKIVFLMFIFLLASEQLTAAPILSVNHGEVEAEKKLVRVGRGDENSDSLSDLMGLERCENGDKECFERRVLAEVHLDYIYTQNHKP
ncbi:OLC1v1004491C2 [Oldenlandia corymbosa var. corymbosa]|uniref:Phytosulfokine n=1 Tax=Oldenlandia corymbosa var. corymbosa TaxID=529605 RepID=A0AAV1DCF9_OLDCO|nr:OLC1v1004491C2 [Oldenlandia corymbosa var. corymbosa]